MNSPDKDMQAKRIRAKFLPDEDAKLRELVKKYGVGHWDIIASEMPGRNVRQVRERWKHYLGSDKWKAPWTQDEDLTLIRRAYEFGPKWTKISYFLPGRSDIQIKQRYRLYFGKQDAKKLMTQGNSAPPVFPFPLQLNTSFQNNATMNQLMENQVDIQPKIDDMNFDNIEPNGPTDLTNIIDIFADDDFTRNHMGDDHIPDFSFIEREDI